MSILAHIADRAINRPLWITPDKADVILSVLSGRIGIEGPDASRFDGQYKAPESNPRGVGLRVVGRVGIISIVGTLVNRGAWIGASSGLVSYEGIQAQIKAAMTMADEGQISALVLDLQTPGGEAIGAMETAAMVRAAREKMTVVAVVNGMAASAGYAIASGATEIVTTETGVSGSIGVVLVHADISGKLAADGIKPTMIFAGDHKVDGNPFEALPESVRADLQREVNTHYALFLKTVAEGRGNRLDADAARGTQARIKIGAEAVEAGLADRIGTFESVLAELSSRAQGGRSTPVQTRRSSMDNQNPTPAATGTVSQADHDAGVAAARIAGAEAERARIAAIVGTEGVKGNLARMTAALDLAAKAPAMSAQDVAAFATANIPDATANPAPAAAPAADLDKREIPDPLAATTGGKPAAVSGLSALVSAQANKNAAA